MESPYQYELRERVISMESGVAIVKVKEIFKVELSPKAAHGHRISFIRDGRKHWRSSPRAGYRYKVIYTIPYIREKYHMPRTLSKLYNLSLEQVIENVNPHKRARYS